MSMRERKFKFAIESLREEFDAINLYQKRIGVLDPIEDEELIAILKHNMDEEKEHVVLLYNWLKANMPGWLEEFEHGGFKPDIPAEIEIPVVPNIEERISKYLWWCYRDWETDRKSTRLNSSHITRSRMPSSA